jgi:hypothetical protein
VRDLKQGALSVCVDRQTVLKAQHAQDARCWSLGGHEGQLGRASSQGAFAVDKSRRHPGVHEGDAGEVEDDPRLGYRVWSLTRCLR